MTFKENFSITENLNFRFQGFNGTIIGNRWNSQGQVWTTFSKISGFEFGVIFNAMLLEDFHIGFEETEFETEENEVFTFKGN